MAIILEKKGGSVKKGTVIGIFTACIILGGGVYWIFFYQVKEVSFPPRDVTGGISKINVDEFRVLSEAKTFISLKQYPRLSADMVRSHLGKPNPFQKP